METKELLEQLVKEVAAQNKLNAIMFLEKHGVIDFDFARNENYKKFIEERVSEFLAWLNRLK